MTFEQCDSDFVNDADSFIRDSQAVGHQVFNTDQFSFNREMHSGRSLDYIGVKKDGKFCPSNQISNILIHGYVHYK